jgi:hypothetical protein
MRNRKIVYLIGGKFDKEWSETLEDKTVEMFYDDNDKPHRYVKTSSHKNEFEVFRFTPKSDSGNNEK